MSDIELTHMTSKGQVVIPFEIRRELAVGEGSVFAVFGSNDTILLKKIEKPTPEELKKDWEALVKQGARKIGKLGINEEDVTKIIHKRRGV